MLLINPYRFAAPFDPAAAQQAADDYIAAVEAADGQSLEAGVVTALEDFIIGLHQDGIWSAIKASCILAGARTLDGALVPLVGTAPTNNNFVSGDYDRETGLIGNGSTKYLDSNRADDDDPQNNAHISANQTQAGGGVRILLGVGRTSPYARKHLLTFGAQYYPRINNSNTLISDQGGGNTIGLFGASRSSASNYQHKSGTGSVTTLNVNSAAPSPLNVYVLAENRDGTASFFYNGRLSFYSIGESINLADLDTRVSTLMTDIAAAIP